MTKVRSWVRLETKLGRSGDAGAVGAGGRLSVGGKMLVGVVKDGEVGRARLGDKASKLNKLYSYSAAVELELFDEN